MASEDPLLISPRRAASLLGLGRDRTYTEVATGALESIRAGRRILIPKASLARWVEAQVEAEKARRADGSEGP